MKYLIWDFDGTLGYRSGGWSKACVDVVKDATAVSNVEIDDVRPHLQTGFPWHTPDQPHPEISTADEWWNQLYPVFAEAIEATGVPSEHACELARQVQSTYLQNDWQVFDDTIPTLSRFSSEGWVHLVLSNHVPELESILRELGLTEYIEETYVSAEIGYEKPHPEAFRPVSSAFEDEATAWMIGDSYRADVHGAETIGLPAVLVRNTHPDADYCCETLVTLDKVLTDQ